MSRRSNLAALAMALAVVAAAPGVPRAKAPGACGEVVTIQTHGRTTTRYAFERPTGPAQGEPIAVVLLPGGGGHLDLDAQGCPRACPRSPASAMESVAARINGGRKQVVTVTGGPGAPTGPQAGIEACVGRAPHGFSEQEAEVAAGIARFIRGARY